MAAAASNSSPLILEDSIAKMRTSQWSTFGIDSEPAQLWVSGGGVNSTNTGQLGDNSSLNKSSPVQISGTNWRSFSGGYYQCVATKTDNTLWAWGQNAYGAIGDGTTINKSSPVQIGGAVWATAAAGGTHTHAIKTDGTLWAWGSNDGGNLGNGTIVNRSSPVQIGSLNTWTNVAAGGSWSAFLRSDGTLWAVGSSGGATGTYVNISSPVQIAGTSWYKIACGYRHIAALRTDGTLWTWGQNDESAGGQLGDGTTVDKNSPVQLAGTWSAVACGVNHTAAIKSDGTLWTWGDSASGQLGIGIAGNGVGRSSPVEVGGQWQNIACGWYFTVGQRTDGTIWAWGNNTSGTLGDGTAGNKSFPQQLPGTNWTLRNVTLNGSVMALRKL